MKIAQQIAAEAKDSNDALNMGAAKAIAEDQVWGAELTKYTFDDNSVLAVQADNGFFGFDADDAGSIQAYSDWLINPEPEADEVSRLLEALEA